MLISPSGKEQVADLMNFGNGVFASIFSIDEEGKWGVIYLIKDVSTKESMTLGIDSAMIMDGHPPSSKSTTTLIPFAAAF
jgi:hypothetical protein